MQENKTQIISTQRTGLPRLLTFSNYGHSKDYILTGNHLFKRKMGQESTDDIAVPSPVISREHGTFGIIEGSVFYRDLGSSNGTYINGMLCSNTKKLEDGDVLAFRYRNKSLTEIDDIAFLMIYTISPETYQWEHIDLTSGINEILIGRSRNPLTLHDTAMSKSHGIFLKSDQGWSITDLNSTNGIYVNQARIEERTWLKKFDVIKIGYTWFVYMEDQLWIGCKVSASDELLEREEQKHIPNEKKLSESLLQESNGNNESPIEASLKEYTVKQPSVTNETDFQRFAPSIPTDQSPASRQVKQINETESLRIHIRERNVWKRFKKKTLLKDIDIQIDPGEFVLILGGSGAGKSTFMKAVIGYEKAEGAITFGDVDIYDDYDVMKYDIGYVPQKDLIRNSDTVFHTIFSAAKLKMMDGLAQSEYLEQTEWVINLLGLSPDRDTLAGKLSGGQKKRLSIAVELVGDPNLFFLDEPDSGLDGVMARSLMLNLKKISDMGKIVMVISHGPDRAADLFSKVLVLAKSEEDQSGHVAFFGNVEDAKEFFEVDHLEDIVRRINRKDEGGEGLADYYIRMAKMVL